jgi:D-alanyl-lipoteichoic acid acyltransferase DltB (MBOAT superfamily)
MHLFSDMSPGSVPFLAMVLLAGLLVHRATGVVRQSLLLAVSLGFYAIAAPRHLGILAVVVGIHFAAIQALHRIRNERARSALLWSTLASGFGLLVFYKVPGEIAAGLLGPVGRDHAWMLIQPLGLSYLVFQVSGALINYSSRSEEPPPGPIAFAAFATFFPQMTAGPISRWDELAPSLSRPEPSAREEAFELFLMGLFKRTVVSNHLSLLVVPCLTGERTGAFPIALALILSPLELYADFSGGTDIARSAALWLGIRLPENFQEPFRASTLSDFWRRWHMSLSGWLRDYVYAPLSFELRRLRMVGIALALMTSFILIGVWHGITWNYLLFGIFHGVGVTTEALTRAWRSRRFPALGAAWRARLGNAFVLLYFGASQVLFRSASPVRAGELFLLRGPAGAENDGVGGYSSMIAGAGLALVLWAGLDRWRRSASSRTWFFVGVVVAIAFWGLSSDRPFAYAAF